MNDEDTLFPELEGEERRQAEEAFDDYLRLILRIYKNLKNDPERYRKFRELLKKRRK